MNVVSAQISTGYSSSKNEVCPAKTFRMCLEVFTCLNEKALRAVSFVIIVLEATDHMTRTTETVWYQDFNNANTKVAQREYLKKYKWKYWRILQNNINFSVSESNYFNLQMIVIQLS